MLSALIDAAQQASRTNGWQNEGNRAQRHKALMEGPVVIRIEGILITSSGEKEKVVLTCKHGYGWTSS